MIKLVIGVNVRVCGCLSLRVSPVMACQHIYRDYCGSHCLSVAGTGSSQLPLYWIGRKWMDERLICLIIHGKLVHAFFFLINIKVIMCVVNSWMAMLIEWHLKAEPIHQFISDHIWNDKSTKKFLKSLIIYEICKWIKLHCQK